MCIYIYIHIHVQIHNILWFMCFVVIVCIVMVCLFYGVSGRLRLRARGVRAAGQAPGRGRRPARPTVIVHVYYM